MGTHDAPLAPPPTITHVKLYGVPAQTLADRVNYFRLLYDLPTSAVVTVAVAGAAYTHENTLHQSHQDSYALVVKPIEHGSMYLCVQATPETWVRPADGIWEVVLLTTGIIGKYYMREEWKKELKSIVQGQDIPLPGPNDFWKK